MSATGPLRLLYVTTSLPYGPGEAFVLPELAELSRRGHQVWVVPMHGRGGLLHAGVQGLLSRCLSATLLNGRIVLGAVAELARAPAASLRASLLLWTTKPRHLVKNLSVLLKGLWLSREVRRLGIDHVHVHWAATTASMGMVASEVSGVPWSFTAHRWDIVENNLLSRKARHASFVRFISRSGLHLARERGLSTDVPAQIIPMGAVLADTPEVTLPQRASLRVLCPANLVPVKGHRHLIEAVRLLGQENVEVWLVGHGELEQELRRQVEALALMAKVRFLGQLPHEELLKLYQRGEVDVVVLPSVDLGGGLHEGIPVSLMEAMAHGIPVISTQTGGIPELLGEGAGRLVPPGDPVALASVLNELLENVELRQTLGRAGRIRVESQFSIQAVVDELERHFHREKMRC